jgi:hypothetical protein
MLFHMTEVQRHIRGVIKGRSYKYPYGKDDLQTVSNGT